MNINRRRHSSFAFWHDSQKANYLMLSNSLPTLYNLMAVVLPVPWCGPKGLSFMLRRGKSELGHQMHARQSKRLIL
ncbi:hypothetical protein MPTK1_5g01130 [Marchantia polymorpha subsp. ruderalis]|uniref:Uncharacterized protein n=2 Tax=Marchantia polymorpha TaxID=3197 RepID=A0AAF6BDM9_MARPO|nr:hypothetical protein MARPO_0197s0007 [Marchantia polymorpha]BBN10113.1 hypothetical protein Mp_5g01130 [Marchantia polymorpha subsp. ruderalis]|eukprot:PTQ27455.1 hypothetical protein MARPO_0197s0007 [Marchantia polymorpha]